MYEMNVQTPSCAFFLSVPKHTSFLGQVLSWVVIADKKLSLPSRTASTYSPFTPTENSSIGGEDCPLPSSEYTSNLSILFRNSRSVLISLLSDFFSC